MKSGWPTHFQEENLWMANGSFTSTGSTNNISNMPIYIIKQNHLLTSEIKLKHFRRVLVQSSSAHSVPSLQTVLPAGGQLSPLSPMLSLWTFNWPLSCLWIVHGCKEVEVEEEEGGDEGAPGGGDKVLELLFHQLPPALCSRLAQLPWNPSLQHRSLFTDNITSRICLLLSGLVLLSLFNSTL